VISARVSAGLAVVVVLHEIGPLTPLLDRGVILREGRVVAQGTLSEIGHAHAYATHDHTGHEYTGPDRPGGLLGGTVERG
jgi:zinc transport system ATP-binding protein